MLDMCLGLGILTGMQVCRFLEMREANICKIRLEELNYDILSRLVTPGLLSMHASTELLLLPPVVGVGQQSPSSVYNGQTISASVNLWNGYVSSDS